MNTQVKPNGGPLKPPTKQAKLMKEAIFVDGKLSHLALEFADGSTKTVEVPHAVFQEAAAFGALTRLGGLTAGEDDLEVIKAQVDETVALWKLGEWRQRAAGGSGTSIIQKALMEYRGVTANQAREFLAKKTMEQKIEMKRIPGLAPIVARLEVEEAAKLLAKGKVEAVDDGLLEGL